MVRNRFTVEEDSVTRKDDNAIPARLSIPSAKSLPTGKGLTYLNTPLCFWRNGFPITFSPCAKMELGIYEMTELPIVSSRNCIAVGEWVVFSDPRLENAYTHSRVQVVSPTLNANHFQWTNEKNPWFWNFLLQVKSIEIFLARVVSPWDGSHVIGYKLLKWGWPLIIILRSMEKKWTAENDWMGLLRLEKIYEMKSPLPRGRKTWGAI